MSTTTSFWRRESYVGVMVVAVVCFTAFFSGIVTVAAANVAASTTAEESTNIKSEHGASNAAQLRAKQKQLSILKLRLQELTRRITNLENEIKGIKVRGQEREGQSNFGRPQHSDKGTASSTVGISCIKDNQKYPLGAELISPSTIYPAPRLVCTNMNGKGVWESVSAAVATTTSVAPRVTFVAERDRLINATVVVPRPSQPRVVTGPTGLGTINWGDGVTENLTGLITGNEMTVKISHRYKSSGTFTVVVTDSNGKSVSQKIEVKTITGVTPRITSLVSTSSRNYTATVVLGRPTKIPAITGPVKLGTISWGDGVTENLTGLITGNEMTVTRNHTYRNVGTYTVTVTELNGVSVSQKVAVSTSTPRIGTPTPFTSVPSSQSVPTAGAVRGATTDVYQNIATVLVSLKQLLDTLEAR